MIVIALRPDFGRLLQPMSIIVPYSSHNMKLRNINGTSDTTCRCGSWLAHWKRFSGQSTHHCPADGCIRSDLVGAHVQKGGASTDQTWYIFPLCTAHNQYTGELEVSDVYLLVPANKSETCERR